MAYLTRDEYIGRSRLPRSVLDKAAVMGTSGIDWLAEQLDIESSFIDSRLRKRYAVPFTAPYSKVLLGWLVSLVDRNVYLKTGYNPNNQDAEQYTAFADKAVEALEDAAKSSDGLYDLPLRQDLQASGLNRTIRGYTEHSPLTGTYNRRDRYEAYPKGKRY